MSEENSPGVKHDQGKPMFSLLPPLSELEVVKTLSFGAEKYSPDNWRKVETRRYVDAAGRHINAHRRGEPMDAESGLHHLAHAICCLMFQLEKELENELEYGQVQPGDIPPVNPGGTAPANPGGESERYARLLKAARASTVDAKQATDGIKSCIATLSSFNPAPEPKAFTVVRQEAKDEPTASRCPAPRLPDVFSQTDIPLIGQDYYYRSNTGEVSTRRWQSTPQEWKRLMTGYVFKTFDACKTAGYIGPYISHEDDPVSYPAVGKCFWYVWLNPVNLVWDHMYIPVGEVKGLKEVAEIHSRGDAATSKEQAEAKALWRNLSMQRHGTPYGPLHPDAKQYDEPLSGSDEGEEHD